MKTIGMKNRARVISAVLAAIMVVSVCFAVIAAGARQVKAAETLITEVSITIEPIKSGTEVTVDEETIDESDWENDYFTQDPMPVVASVDTEGVILATDALDDEADEYYLIRAKTAFLNSEHPHLYAHKVENMFKGTIDENTDDCWLMIPVMCDWENEYYFDTGEWVDDEVYTEEGTYSNNVKVTVNGVEGILLTPSSMFAFVIVKFDPSMLETEEETE
jgi:hypothetical protein